MIRLMKEIGLVRSGYYCPHIYFIFSLDVVYIGETQIIPVRRWSSHLDSTGSFSKKLDKNLSSKRKKEYLDSLSFYSLSCLDDLRSMEKSYCGYRIPTQALEHKLHEIVKTQAIFGRGVKVISETKRTAPRNFDHWKEVEMVAERFLSTMRELLKGAPLGFFPN